MRWQKLSQEAGTMQLKAHAKINLGLAVVAKRPDGFHDIDTLFARIALHDKLSFKSTKEGIRLEVTGADLPLDRNNLIYQAAELYLQEAKLSQGIHIHLNKRIPIAAGLGGGSSDAATVLRALDRLYPAGLDLRPIAARLGSDVPFFLESIPLAHGTSRGEVLNPLATVKRHLVLINPGIHVSAKEAYSSLKRFDEALRLKGLLESLKNHKEPEYLNSLEPGVLALYPDIARVLEALKVKGLQGVLMSGSGSSCFGLAHTAAEAKNVAAELQKDHAQWWVQATCLY